MINFLVVQSTYQDIEIALMEDHTSRAFTRIDKKDSSTLLIPTLNRMLTENSLTLEHVTFMAVNRGPGPFTTLRVALATVNGISFSSAIPIVGVDGLRAFIAEQQQSSVVTVALLNAFGNDVYYGIQGEDCVTTGCKNKDVVLQEIKAQFPATPVRFIGNGAQLYQQEIGALFGSQALGTDPIPSTVALAQVAREGLRMWQAREGITHQVQPLYLKMNVI